MKRREIAESVISGRKSGAEMARLYDFSSPTVRTSSLNIAPIILGVRFYSNPYGHPNKQRRSPVVAGAAPSLIERGYKMD